MSDKFPRVSALEQNMRLLFSMKNHGVELSFEKKIFFGRFTNSHAGSGGEYKTRKTNNNEQEIQ